MTDPGGARVPGQRRLHASGRSTRLVLTSVVLLGILLGIADPASGQAVKEIAPPPTARVDEVDVYHGQRVRDPYRWLERVDSAPVVAWARAQDSVARTTLAAPSWRPAVARRIRAHTSTRDYSVPVRAAERLFYLVLEPGSNHSALAMRHGTEERIVWSPDEPIAQLAPSPSGRSVLVTLAPEDEAPRTVLVDVETGGAIDVRRALRISRSPWTRDGLGFFYLAADEQGDDALGLRHPSLREDEPVDLRGLGVPPGYTVAAHASDNGDWLVVTARSAEAERIIALRLTPDGRRQGSVLLREGTGRYHFVGEVRGTFWFRTADGAGFGRIVRVDAGSPDRAQPVIPESQATLVDAFVFGERLVAHYLREARPEVQIFSLDGRHERTVPLPLGLVFTDYLRDWPGFAGDALHPEAYLRSLNPTAPGIYRLDVRDGSVTPFLLRGVGVREADFVMELVSYESADGTSVPLFVAHRRDVRLDGSAPALMFAYGAYGWTPVPFFNAKYLTFLEAGGVLAIPYARGGGVRGEAWHRAGIRSRKQQTIDDVIAAAEWLVRHGYTRPDRLALEGQGPAGAAVGGAFTQRPDLFAAVIFDVAVADMLRREAAGNPMVGELGSVSDPQEFRALLAYSPYHAALDGGPYPAALIKTGDSDAVVPPMHAYKLTAALQAAGGRDRAPHLLRVEWRTGHGFGKGLEGRRDEWTDDLVFLGMVLEGAGERLERLASDGYGAPSRLDFVLNASSGTTR